MMSISLDKEIIDKLLHMEYRVNEKVFYTKNDNVSCLKTDYHDTSNFENDKQIYRTHSYILDEKYKNTLTYNMHGILLKVESKIIKDDIKNKNIPYIVRKTYYCSSTKDSDRLSIRTGVHDIMEINNDLYIDGLSVHYTYNNKIDEITSCKNGVVENLIYTTYDSLYRGNCIIRPLLEKYK